jgi:hypothetical protein
MASQNIAPTDRRISWYGHVSLQKTKGGLKPWRIFHEDRELYFPMLMERTQKSSGVRVAFFSDTETLSAHIAPWNEPSNVDVCGKGKHFCTIELEAGKERWHLGGLPGVKTLIEIWFPPKAHTILKALTIDKGASLAPFVDKRPKWVTYGSSVTQCSDAKSPIFTWPAIVARNCGFNLTNLGMSGECVLDMMFARVMRDIPADLFSMEIGPNIYGHNALNERSFRWSLLAFVQIVREKHPNTPFVLCSPIYYPIGETVTNKAGFTMQMMRAELAAAAETLRAHGDKNFHFVDGLTLLGPEHAHLLPDNCHPSPDGYALWGENFTNYVARKFFLNHKGRRGRRATHIAMPVCNF